jgi:hypothetical protein
VEQRRQRPRWLGWIATAAMSAAAIALIGAWVIG